MKREIFFNTNDLGHTSSQIDSPLLGARIAWRCIRLPTLLNVLSAGAESPSPTSQHNTERNRTVDRGNVCLYLFLMPEWYTSTFDIMRVWI